MRVNMTSQNEAQRHALSPSSSTASSPISPLASPTATQAVLERHGFNTKKALGQNFLVNDAIVRKIVELADVKRDDAILEIGPGIGTLTYALLAHAGLVVAVERDAMLPGVLSDTLSDFADRFFLIEADALDVIGKNLATFDYVGQFPNKFVSNLPYAVAATVVLDCFQKMPEIESATVMVQREVAERMCATPGTKAYGAYTVKLAMYAESMGQFQVGPNNFMPRPHVESAVLRLDRHMLNIDAHTRKAACTMADAAFFARRKTIVNSCKQYFAGRDKRIAEHIPEILAAANVDPKTRGETLPPETFIDLARALSNMRTHQEPRK